MGYVTSLFAHKVLAAAGDGVDAAAMLASVGIAAEDPCDAGRMIPAERYYDMLERIAGQIDVTCASIIRATPLHLHIWLLNSHFS